MKFFIALPVVFAAAVVAAPAAPAATPAFINDRESPQNLSAFVRNQLHVLFFMRDWTSKLIIFPDS